MTHAAPPPRVRKQPQDTVAGCRERAAANRAEASPMGATHSRSRLELSADTWTKRADMLQRIETNFQARMASEAAASC